MGREGGDERRSGFWAFWILDCMDQWIFIVETQPMFYNLLVFQYHLIFFQLRY